MNLMIPAAIVLLGLIAGGVVKSGSELVDKLDFKIDPVRSLKDISISNWVMEFPVFAKIINPSKFGLPIDHIFASIYKKEGSEWRFLGSTQPDLTHVLIHPDATTAVNFKIKIPVETVGQEVYSFFSNLLSNNAGSRPKATYMVEVKVKVEGITFTENFEQTV